MQNTAYYQRGKIKMVDSFIVSIDMHPNGKDLPVLVVGRKKPGKLVEVVNVISGDEAIKLYNKLARPNRIPEIDK